MRVTVKFLEEIVKNGKLRKVGDTLEIDSNSAALLAKAGTVEIPGYKVETEKVEIEKPVLVEEA